MFCKIEEHSGFFKFHVPNVNNIRVDDIVESAIETIGGIQWKITLWRREEYAAVRLHCRSDTIPVFAAKTHYEAVLITTGTPKGFSRAFDFQNNTEDGEMNSFNWKLMLTNPDGELAADSTLLYEVRLSFQLHILPDFSARAPLRETRVVCGERTFYASALLLTANSPFFQKLLLSDSGEVNEMEVEVNTTPETLLTVLRLLHCFIYDVDEANVEDVLAFSDSVRVRNRCAWLLTRPPTRIPRAYRLFLADKYGLRQERQEIAVDIRDANDALKTPFEAYAKNLSDDETAHVAQQLIEIASRHIRDPADSSKSIVDMAQATCSIM